MTRSTTRVRLIRVPKRTSQHTLSMAQRKVAHLIALGMTTDEVAAELSLTLPSVERHLSDAYRILGVHRREDLIDLLYRPFDDTR